MKINAIIVTYNSTLIKSDTIASVFSASLDKISLTITIWNNGPELLNSNDVNEYMEKCQSLNISSSIYQDIRNISLSKIYNFILKRGEHDFFVILDQDTKINPDFFSNIEKNSDCELICPQVYIENNDNKLDSPVYRDSLKKIPTGYFNANNMLTCGSGLSISRLLYEKTLKHSGFIFDERYAFYLADDSFLLNMKKFDYVKGMCIGEIHHNLSGFGKNYKEMKESSKLELGYSIILRRINEQKKDSILKNIFHAIKFIVKAKCSYSNSLNILRCALTKTHPRTYHILDENIRPTNSLIESEYKNN
ncbi:MULTISPECIES: glycosyltransferase family 2 protein [Pectobacterium]|uniref:glycosyltransferase family 2 protein n=1 Tax=Pectobacterium TaxID=122277 RepID=UPI0015F4E1D2|nr:MULTISPECIES: glycosyl transferase [Pectobacterium]MBA5603006.1 glycosyl transferase [Pectobacterium aroidearum]QPI42888.1 glycosyl transferase [Pectobacterium aroidearum]